MHTNNIAFGRHVKAKRVVTARSFPPVRHGTGYVSAGPRDRHSVAVWPTLTVRSGPLVRAIATRSYRATLRKSQTYGYGNSSVLASKSN